MKMQKRVICIMLTIILLLQYTYGEKTIDITNNDIGIKATQGDVTTTTASALQINQLSEYIPKLGIQVNFNAPGWNVFDDDNKNIWYENMDDWHNGDHGNFLNGGTHNSRTGKEGRARFNFIGSQFILAVQSHYGRNQGVQVIIDGELVDTIPYVGNYGWGHTIYYICPQLFSGEHSVELNMPASNTYMMLDIIQVNENGTIKPYELINKDKYYYESSDESNENVYNAIVNKKEQIDALGIEEINITWSTNYYKYEEPWSILTEDSQGAFFTTFASIDYVKDGSPRHENFAVWNEGYWKKGNSVEGENGDFISAWAGGDVISRAISRPNSYFIPKETDEFSIYSILPEIINIKFNSEGIINYKRGTKVNEPLPVTTLLIKEQKDYSIKLQWYKPYTNLPIESYKIYRNGVEIEETQENTFKDTNIDYQTLYNYTVAAIYEGEIQSENGNQVNTIIMEPYISQVTPTNQSTIGGDSVNFKINYMTNNSLEECNLKVEYTNESEYYSIPEENIKGSQIEGGISYSAIWDLEDIISGNYVVRISMEDERGIHILKELNYVVDTTKPSQVISLKAEPGEKQIEISWQEIDDDSIAYYEIHRSEVRDGVYTKLATIETGKANSYLDKAIEAEKEYYYKLYTKTRFGIIGEASESIMAIALKDTTPPEVIGIVPSNKSKIGKEVVVTVRTQDNIGIKSTTLQYLNEEGKWIEIDTVSNQSEAIFSFTNPKKEGTLTIKAIATDTSDNTNIEEVIRTYTIVAPNCQTITFNTVETSSTQMMLKWDKLDIEDFEKFIVYLKNPQDGSLITSIETGNVLGTNISNLVPQTDYLVQVIGYDIWKNEAGISEELCIRTTNDGEIPCITAISPSSSRLNKEVNISIQAEDNHALQNIIFQYSLDCLNWQEFASTNINNEKKAQASATLSLLSFNEGSIFIRGIAVDNEGNRSIENEQASFVEYVVDRTAPQVPLGLKVEEDVEGIVLTWLQGQEEDIVGYDVYKYDEREATYKQVAANLQALYYREPDKKPKQNYKYKINCIDSAGNRSEFSKEVEIIASNDIQAPTITSIAPSNNAKIAINPTISVAIYDNYKLGQVVLDYQKQGELEWNNIDTIATDEKSGIFEFKWETDKLESGIYNLRCYAIDSTGNRSIDMKVSYELNTGKLPAPTISGQPGPWQVQLNWKVEQDAHLIRSYKIYRKEGLNGDFTLIAQTEQVEYIDKMISPQKAYTYKITARDIYGRESNSNEITVIPLAQDPYAPTARLGYSMAAMTGRAVVFDASLSSDNDEIVSYKWDFGDGKQGAGIAPKHVFEEEGVYETRLTVQDAYGNTDSASINVYVYSAHLTGEIRLKVLDQETGLPIPNALVYVDAPSIRSEDLIILRADQSGMVSIYQRDGNYNIAAYATNYLPKEVNMKVARGRVSEQTIRLSKGEPIIGDIQVHKMTMEEMQEAGIDLSNPDNQHSFSFNIHLTFQELDLPIICNSKGEIIYHGSTNESGGGGGANASNYVVGPLRNYSGNASTSTYIQAIPAPEGSNEPPAISTITVPQKISWLKEFFNVSVTVQNVCDSQFVVQDSTIEIQLPPGLSLVQMLGGNKSVVDDQGNQMAEVKLDDLAGGEKAEYSWFVRGDSPGEYNIDVNYNGMLMPFRKKISAIFRTSEPVTVSKPGGLAVNVQVEDAAYTGVPYYVYFQIINTSSEPIYNLQWMTGTEQSSAIGTYCMGGYLDWAGENDRSNQVGKEYDEFSSQEGEKMKIDKVHIPDLDIHDFANIEGIEESDKAITVEVLEPGESIYLVYNNSIGAPDGKYNKLIEAYVTSQSMDIPVSISVIPAHNPQYRIAEPELVEDPVNVVTGGQETTKTLMALQGLGQVTFEAYYSSLTPEEQGEDETPEQMGPGWYHNYEMKLEQIEGNTKVLVLHLSPVNVLFLFDKSGNGIYTSNSPDLKDVQCVKSGEQYIYTDVNKQEFTFNNKGRLTSIQPKGGSILDLSYKDDVLSSVSERNSNIRLTFNYDGQTLLRSVTDQVGRIVQFDYNSDRQLVSMTDMNGKTETYTYTGKYHIHTMTNAEGITYLTNTYDEKGRVLIQDDARSGNELATFTYDDKSFWRYIVTVKNRLGHNKTYVYNRDGLLIMETEEVSEARTKVRTLTYDSKGNQVSDTNGDVEVTYEYNGNNQVTKITDPENTVTYMAYDGNGNVTSIVNEEGEASYFTYNENNQILTMREPSGKVTQYEYDEYSRILSEEVVGLGKIKYDYKNGLLTSVTDSRGNANHMTYDEAGRLKTTTDREGNTTTYEYDHKGNLLSLTDALGYKTSYTYDSRGNQLTITGSKGNTAHFEYDGNNNLVKAIDCEGNTIHYIYDGNDRLIKTIYPDGSFELKEYNYIGDLIKTVDTKGAITVFHYDTRGSLDAMTLPDGEKVIYGYFKNTKLRTMDTVGKGSTKYSYDKAWNLTGKEDAEGHLTQYGYDQAGNLIWSKDGEGNTRSYAYDNWGRLVNETDARGYMTSYAYDLNDNLTTVTDALGNVTTYTYDKEDRVVAITDANGNTTTFKYDALGRLISATDSLGRTVRREYDEYGNLISDFDAAGVRLFTNTYDSLNNLVSTTDALGYTTSNVYNQLNQVIEVVDALNRTTKITYDQTGNVSQVEDPEKGISKAIYTLGGKLKSYSDPGGGGYTYTYNQSGQMVKETTSLGYSHSYTYNNIDQLKSSTNGRGQNTTYAYDKAGRITSFTDEVGKVSYRYDANGNVLQVLDEKNSIQREYDALNRVIKYIEANGMAIRYEYDAVGNVTKVIYSNNKEVKYRYNAVNQVTEVEDWAGRKTKYSYDINGRLEKTIRSDGSVQINQYDALGQLVGIIDKTGTGQVINSYSYTYDGAGNIVEETKAQGGVKASAVVSETVAMTYDKDNRLSTYNGKKVIYDQDGNLTYGPLNGKWVEFEYDARNRLIRAGDTIYEYDGENNRIAVIEAGKRTAYVVDSNYELPRTIAQIEEGEPVTWYIYGKGLLAQEQGDHYFIYHFDNRGSTTALTNSKGEVTDRFSYTAYGELVDHQGSNDVIFKYNGRSGVITDSNGLYYMCTRYYNPDIKRFMNADVIVGNVLDGRSLNRHAYVNGNPINYSDPFGLSPEKEEDEGINEVWLDVAGFMPVLGDIIDAVNAVNYLKEGEYGKAAFYLGCVFGADLIFKGVKYLGKGLKTAGKLISDVLGKVGAKSGKEIAKQLAEKTSFKIVGSVTENTAERTVREAGQQATERNIREVAQTATERNIKEAVEDTVVEQTKNVKYKLDLQFFADKGGRYSGTGKYGDVGGHHVHAKAGFKGASKYDPNVGFSISQDFMERNGLNHQKMTSKQRELFKELYESGRPNTLDEHTRIAREALKAGGAGDSLINDLLEDSLSNLAGQGVKQPTRIPWYSK